MSRVAYNGFFIESFDGIEFFTYIPNERGGDDVITSKDIEVVKQRINDFNLKYF